MYTDADPIHGIAVFAALSIWGLRLIYKGFYIPKPIATEGLGGIWYILFGLLIQAPLVVFVLFLYRTGYFRNYAP